MSSISYKPTLLSGGSSITFDYNVNYFKFHKLVYIAHAFWSTTISNPNSDILILSIKYRAVSSRNAKLFGYCNFGSNLMVNISTMNGQQTYTDGCVFVIKGTDGQTTELKGTDWKSFTGQYQVFYIST